MSNTAKPLLVLPCQHPTKDRGDRLEINETFAGQKLSIRCFERPFNATVTNTAVINIDAAQAVELGTLLIKWAHGLEVGS